MWSTDRSIAVPEELADQAGLRQDQVKVSKKYGGGYPANVEGLVSQLCMPP